MYTSNVNLKTCINILVVNTDFQYYNLIPHPDPIQLAIRGWVFRNSWLEVLFGMCTSQEHDCMISFCYVNAENNIWS